MSNSIQEVRTVFDIVRAARKNGQPMTETEIQAFLLRIVSDKKIRERYSNFEQGYAAEELFRRIYSLLPWVKLITPLGQEQYPEKSKEETQVPDYIVTFEAGSQDNVEQVLVEAKLISNDKQTFVLPKYKYEVLRKYEQDMNVPLIYAIFWRTRMMWTLNSIESFVEKSSEYKLSFDQACKNDMSAIFGDYTYLFDKKIFRKSLFSNLNDVKSDYVHFHEEYGRTMHESISSDNKEYIDLNWIETPVLDCAFDFEEVQHIAISEFETKLLEQLKNVTYTYKLSSLLLGYLSKVCCYDNEDMYYDDNILVQNAFNIVDIMRQKCGGKKYYILPHDKATSIDKLMKIQFGTTHIYDEYCNNNNIQEMILCSHD